MDHTDPARRRDLPSLARALRAMREAAAREHGLWHESPTRRFGVRVAWRTDVLDGERHETVRVYRELIRPYSEDLIAVARRLPHPLQIHDVEVVATERLLYLRLRAAESGATPPREDCARCRRPRHPLRPLFGAAELCATCATAPLPA